MHVVGHDHKRTQFVMLQWVLTERNGVYDQGGGRTHRNSANFWKNLSYCRRDRRHCGPGGPLYKRPPAWNVEIPDTTDPRLEM